MPKILEILQKYDSNNDTSLRVNETGELETYTSTWIDKLKLLVGYKGETGKKVAEYILAHKDQLYKECAEYFKQGQSIIKLQPIVDRIFSDTAIKQNTPNIIEHIFSNWMSYVPDSLKKKPITKLLVPGTHDSAAHKIDWSHVIENSHNKNLTIASTILGYAVGVNKLVDNWTITQNKSISSQLGSGIRSFDLRVAYDEVTHKFYLGHTFNLGELEQTLEEFKTFLDGHPSEVVMINIKEDWEYRETLKKHEAELGSLIHKQLGSHLTTDYNITIERAQAKHTNALVICDLYKSNNNLSSWNVSHYGDWKKHRTVESTLKDLDSSLSQPKAFSNKPFQYTSFTITPDVYTIISNFSLSNVTHDLNSHFNEFVDSHPTAMHGLSVINMDFPTYEMIEKVISINMQHE